MAKEFWLLYYAGLPDNFFSLDFSAWLTSNLSSSTSSNLIPWPTWFNFSLWTLWIKQNNKVYSKPNPTTYISFSLTISSALNFFFSQSHQSQGVSKLYGFSYQLAFLPSNLIQVDASFLPTSNLCTIGVACFSDPGIWFSSFILSARTLDANMAELLAIIIGFMVTDLLSWTDFSIFRIPK